MDIDPRALFPALGLLIGAALVWSWYRARVLRLLIQREGDSVRATILAVERRRLDAEKRAQDDRDRRRLWPEGGETDRDQLREGSGVPPSDGGRGSS